MFFTSSMKKFETRLWCNVDVPGTSPQKVRKTWPGSFQIHSSVFIAATTHLAIPVGNRKNPYLTTNVAKLVERFPFYRYQSTINQSTINEEINGKWNNLFLIYYSNCQQRNYNVKIFDTIIQYWGNWSNRMRYFV